MDVTDGRNLALHPFTIVREPDESDEFEVAVVAYGLELPDRSAVVVWAVNGDGYGGVGQFSSPERALAVVGLANPDCLVRLVPTIEDSCGCESPR